MVEGKLGKFNGKNGFYLWNKLDEISGIRDSENIHSIEIWFFFVDRLDILF